MWTAVFSLAPVVLSTFYAFLPVPTVQLDRAVIIGKGDGAVDRYLGIPYAKAPRFRLPIPIEAYSGIVNGRKFGPSCVQQKMSPTSKELPLPPPLPNQSEDCLSLNVIVPKGTKTDDKLPVAFIIHGGGFQIGSSAEEGYAIKRVKRSIELGIPIIVVSINYRLSAYGFLAGKEVQDEGSTNVGLHDQRVALRWAQKHIQAFGGDPTRVTINGGSAGAVSVAYQMIAFGGENESLFSAAFSQSGSIFYSSPVSKGQVYYDQLVKDADCEDSPDPLNCLRNLPIDLLIAAVDKSPDIFSYRGGAIVWAPHIDGTFVEDSPFSLVREGKVTKVPVVTGNMDDEGTFFALQYGNMTSDKDYEDWIRTYWFPDATPSELQSLWKAYPSIPSEGSPFGTGNANQAHPQFKRIAAFTGDVMFNSGRRYFSTHLAKWGEQSIWSYRSTKLKKTPLAGSFHGSDYATGMLEDHFIYFVNYHDPNPRHSNLEVNTNTQTPIQAEIGPVWPQYTSENDVMYTFNDEGSPYLSKDDFRKEAMEVLTEMAINRPMF